MHAEGVRRLASVAVGGALGYGADVLLMDLAGLLPSHARETFVQAALLAYPIARLLAFVTRWPLEAEPAMFIYTIAIPATFILVGMIGGHVIPRWRW